MELTGPWVAAEADDEIRRNGINLGCDDSTDSGDWTEVAVPGHWQSTDKFATSNGPMMYRTRFTAPTPTEGRRRWVTLDGIFYQGDVWLDGAYLGDPEGYFFPHSFDITDLSRFDEEHVLAIEVTCAPQTDPRSRRNITGVLQQSEWFDQRYNPGGLWRPVRLYDTGPVRIDRLRVLCRDADARRAHLRLTARLDSDAQRPVLIRTMIDGHPHAETTHVVAIGQNDLEWSIDLADPALWWPRSLGAQPLTMVSVEVFVDEELSDRRQRRTGLRQVSWDDWVCSVNGERLFLKGANLLPTSSKFADAHPTAMRDDIESAVDLGLDALRVHGHVAHRHTYAAADELGILLLQDFPLQWRYARSVRPQAVEQARALVDALGHHPSIASWSAHDDPTLSSVRQRTSSHVDQSGATGRPDRRRSRLRSFAAQQLPTWNKSVLDRWVKRSFERHDPTRATVAHSGVVPHLPQLDGTDSHLTFGWQHGEAVDLAGFAARLPSMVRFVSEFGADSVPSTHPFLDDALAEGDWPDLEWERLADANGYDIDTFERLFPPSSFNTFEEWKNTTQYYQSHVLKVQIETLRTLKYRPTGGFCFSSLADPAPLVSSSVLDHERVPKDAYEIVRAACAPLLVVAEPLPDWVNPGERITVDVHLVSDLRTPIDFAVVDATATWAGGNQHWRFGGPVPADDVVKVGQIELVVPDTLGELAIELEMSAHPHRSMNRYTTAVTLPPT
jgi:beta-mannosidase